MAYATHADAEADIAARGLRILTKTTITGNYTLLSTDDDDKVLHVTASTPVTITLPSQATAAIPNEIAIPWRQFGTGAITFAAGSGATVVSRGGALTSAGQYAEGVVTKTGTNAWILSGDITP